jgi:hypothetical protein
MALGRPDPLPVLRERHARRDVALDDSHFFHVPEDARVARNLPGEERPDKCRIESAARLWRWARHPIQRRMDARDRFLAFPPGYDPFAPRVVATTAFPAKRLIVVLRSDAKADRYALHRFPDGSVSWRADTFTAPEHPAEPECWIAYRGELTVAEVIEHVPDQARVVLEWTREEIARDVDVSALEDVHIAERRALSLRRLSGELDDAAVAAARRAA